jgi:aryl-alcohol dehydrogenase-like predicted oxidoreductase
VDTTGTPGVPDRRPVSIDRIPDSQQSRPLFTQSDELRRMTDMEYTTLGDTGLEVSRLCLGCMNFGTGAEWMMNDREASLDLLDRAFELGFNFLDTANVYSQGESEEIVGEAIAAQDAFSREELVVATKVFGPMGDGPNQQGLSRKHILDQCEASLDRLGLDYLDLYQIHRWDDDTPVEETLAALDHLIETGTVRYVGASTMTSYEFTKALYTADVENYHRFVCMQPEYNAVDRHEEANLLPVCAGEGIGVIPWSPLAGGFLTGKYDREGAGDRSGAAGGSETRRADADEYTENRFTEANWAVLAEIEAIADELDATPAQVSLAWLLHKPVVDSPIVGPRSVEHLEENVGALDVSLTDDHLARIEAPKTPRWPAPGKD